MEEDLQDANGYDGLTQISNAPSEFILSIVLTFGISIHTCNTNIQGINASEYFHTNVTNFLIFFGKVMARKKCKLNDDTAIDFKKLVDFFKFLRL
jgi:hypothetical protein